MKNLIGLLLFAIASQFMSWSMGMITDKRVQREVIAVMQKAWTGSPDFSYDCPPPQKEAQS
jgi:hypothetical protein